LNWMTLSELVGIHAWVIEETGGTPGVLHPGTVEAALARPFTSFGDVDLFDLYAKVAALIHSIIAFHPFADGNKRTALVAGDVCLRLNDRHLVSSEEVEPFFWAIARGEKSVEEIASWLQTHTEPWLEP
jgi:death-on-curing protein